MMKLNIAQCCDALDLLRSLLDGCTPQAFFDPEYRAVLDHLKFATRARASVGVPDYRQ